MVARFREADEATSVADRRGSILDIIRGQRLGSLPGGFLVNFLCKENWNTGVSEALSKEDNVQIKINVFLLIRHSTNACAKCGDTFSAGEGLKRASKARPYSFYAHVAGRYGIVPYR